MMYSCRTPPVSNGGGFDVKAAIKHAVHTAFNLPGVRQTLLARLRGSVSVLMYHGVVLDESSYDA